MFHNEFVYDVLSFFFLSENSACILVHKNKIYFLFIGQYNFSRDFLVQLYISVMIFKFTVLLLLLFKFLKFYYIGQIY